MMNVRWRGIFGLAFLLALGKVSFAQNNQQVYWYVDGEKQSFTLQADEAVLKLNGRMGSQLPVAGVLKQLDAEQSSMAGFVSLQFESAAELQDKQSYLSNLRGIYPQGNLILTLQQPGKEKPLRIDEKLFVAFEHYVSFDEIGQFATKYNMEWLNPIANLPSNYKYVCIFRQKDFSISNNTALLSAKIVESEGSRIAFANPNIVALPNEGFQPDGINDNDLDKAWYIDNHGQRINCAPNGGTTGADAGILEVWNMGYTGQGIRIGVIDFAGFDYNHPDMQGQLLPGWNCVNNTPYNASNAPYDATFGGHGMAVAGIIGAKGGNGVGAAGVAYGAQIIPFLVNGQEDMQLVIAMQKAMEPEFNVDVLNFSLGIDHPSDAIRTQIENLATAGRVRYGNTLGVVMVASHGNNGYYDGDLPQWPAAYPQVIAVGSSTPDDKAKVSSDNWNLNGTAWGTNYGDNLDVVAPGVCIYTTDMSGSQGYISGDYTALGKTSASAPIVTGVVALLLSKNADLHADEVMDILTQNADKVNANQYDYNYDGNIPGRSLETGFGRINAFRALGGTTVGIGDEPAPESGLTISVSSPVQHQATIHYHSTGEKVDLTMQVFDLSGKLLHTQMVGKHEEEITLDVSENTPGMYIARFMNKEDELVHTAKFVKLW
ncbi:MAG: S8 family serine peptidase [Chitinophagales bacterium]|nr:S8 family serine peptidase [Chitinophagales bacterium]